MVLYQTDNSRPVTNNDIRIYRDFSYVTHFHRDIELICMVKGRLRITVEGKVFTAEEGQMALISSNLIHSYESLTETLAVVHVFSRDNVPTFAKFVGDKIPACPVFDCDERVKAFYLDYCINGEKRSNIAIKAGLYAVCSDFLEKCELVCVEKGSSELVHRMLSYISKKYREEITLESMARELGYEMHYLSRVFSKCVGINLRRYINLYRIDAAKERLTDSEENIASIALESGFQSIRNFNRVFYSFVGVTPLEYRKQSFNKSQND